MVKITAPSVLKKLTLLLFFFMTALSIHPGLLAEESPVSYDIRFYGTEDHELLSYLRTYSDLARLKDRPPASIRLLKKRTDSDRIQLIKLLKARGLFKAKVHIDIDTLRSPASLSVRVNPGPRFILKNILFRAHDENSRGLSELTDIKTGLEPGTPYSSELITESRKNLIYYLKKSGFPFARIWDIEITADHQDNTVNITWVIDAGRKAVFGKTAVSGLESVDESYILKKILWKQGDPYHIDLVEKTEKSLSGLGLFAVVRIIEGSETDHKGEIPITIELKERKHKTIGAGLFYRTDEGPGVKFMWENRNLAGRDEKFSVSTQFSDFTAAAEAMFRKPDFYREDQNIRISLRIAEDDPVAYRSTYLETTAIIERRLGKYLEAGGGFAYRASTVEQADSENSFNLFYVPVFIRRDSSDDLLDPGRGSRISMEITPFYDTSGAESMFVKGIIDLRLYRRPLNNEILTLAAGISIGSIYGGSTSYEIPADERFYAGGGGSVRGYAYQSIGPYSGGSPLGGRSILEISLEPRIRLSEKLGLALFIDGGGTFSGRSLSSREDILWGAGSGLRYYTPIGPLRADIAFPLNRRKGIDDSFQLYLSIGQAF